MAKHNKLGKIGEDIACDFLSHKKGLEIIERNFRKPYGEIDIVARGTGGKLHFVEVKAVSRGTYRPEEHLHPWKLKRLSRIFQVYLASHRNPEWQFDVVCVYVNEKEKQARVKMMENIIIGA